MWGRGAETNIIGGAVARRLNAVKCCTSKLFWGLVHSPTLSSLAAIVQSECAALATCEECGKRCLFGRLLPQTTTPALLTTREPRLLDHQKLHARSRRVPGPNAGTLKTANQGSIECRSPLNWADGVAKFSGQSTKIDQSCHDSP